MLLGLDKFLSEEYKHFQNKRIGLITNLTGVNKDLLPAIDLFYHHPSINLVSLFAPEHGIRGDGKEGELIESYKDPYTGLPVYSLYGESRIPSEEMLEDIDVLVFDLQDIGSRYYTFIYTMAYVMEACEKYNKHFVVLDRPNPVSGIEIEGNLVKEDVRSFVGLLPIPNRHGMTVGELSLLFKNEFNYNCELSVIKMDGWKREMYFDETGLLWVPPSPNTTLMDMNILYAGTCLIEGTNLSEGRGTTRPFEVIGAPYVDGVELANAFNDEKVPGVLARPTWFIPNYQKYKGENCSGIQLHITNRAKLKPLEAVVELLTIISKLYPNDFKFNQTKDDKYFFDLLAGNKTLKNDILHDNISEYLNICEVETKKFKKQREPYLLY